MPDMTTAIEIKNLTKDYKDVRAVDSLNLTIYQEELFSLLGVNGAGKTTTIKMLSCVSSPTCGDAFVNGMSVKARPTDVKKIIAVSPQQSAIARNLSVKENLKLMCGVHGFDKEKTARKVRESLGSFGLSQVAARKAAKLSGGWQRRLSLAMALISEPKILFLDEPTLGLDVIARSELWDTIRELKSKMTIVLTTHYMEEAEALSDRIGIMKEGRLVFCGTAVEMKAKSGRDNIESAFIEIVKNASKGTSKEAKA